MEVIIVGEDLVTREIIKKLIASYRPELSVSREEPIRGGEIKDKIKMYNLLGLPVIALTDLDEFDCPPSLITSLLGNVVITPFLLLRVAVYEAESWLMSDRQGFANFLKIDLEKIPVVKNLDYRNPENVELLFKYKPSLYLMKELALQSKDPIVKQQLMPLPGAKKGKEYNTALLPFIRNVWNVEAAKENSYSLKKAISRLTVFQLPVPK